MSSKRIISAVLAAVMTISSSTAFANAASIEALGEGETITAETLFKSVATSESDFSWGYRGDGSGAVVMGYNGADADVIIPSEVFVDGKIQKVIEIGNCAFMNHSEINSVYIPDGVECIGASAFNWCSNLTSVRIPDSVTTIGKSAFECCQKLLSVKLPNGISEICDHTFDNCFELKNIILPEKLKAIGAGAFASCFGLENIVIPDSVNEIGNAAFHACSCLKSIIAGKNIKKIGALAFSSNRSLETVKFLGDDFEMPIDAIAQNDEQNFFAHKNLIIYANKNTDAEVAAKRLGCTFKTLDETESIDYSQIKGCADVTLALYNAYSDYLTKYYIQKVPDAALEAFCCSDQEHLFFKTLTNEIIKDTPKEHIPEKLYNWMNENVANRGLQAGYPMDVYHYKSADCLGNAYLLCELLRCAEIPAVVAFGCSGDMKNTLAEYNVLFRNINGSEITDHAWVFYYLDGKWCVADSALDLFTSDINEISAHYYIYCVDGLALVTDYYTQIASNTYRTVDENGKFGNSLMVGSIECGSFGICIGGEGIFLNWGADFKEFGQEEWQGGGYIQNNGYLKVHCSKIIDGKNYWFAQNSFPYDITDVPVNSYFFGCPVFKVGDTFKLKLSYLYDDTEYTFSESAIASIDSEKMVTIIGEGMSSIEIDGMSSPFEFYAFNPEHYKSIGLAEVSVSSDAVTLSWDKVDEAHNYVIKHLVDGVWIDDIMLDSNTSSVEITGLNEGTEYTFGMDIIAPLANTGAFRFVTEDEVLVTPGVKGETTFKYVDNFDGTITITGGKIYDSEVTIPNTIDGKKVSSIAEKAFEGNSVMTDVTVPDSVTNIGDKALGFNKKDSKYPDFKLKGYEDSAIYYYAIRYDIPFEIIGEASADNQPYKDENSKSEIVEVEGAIPNDVKPEDRITDIVINPAFNLKNKDESGIGLDLTQIKVKAKEIYTDEGLKRAEEALGTELTANKHYNLLDLTLIMDDGKNATDISNAYEGLVKVTIPIPAGHRGKIFYCYRINDNGTKEIIPGTQTEDSYIVYLEHFSMYALVADENNNIAVEITIKSPANVDTSNRMVTIVGDSVNRSVKITNGTINLSGIADGDYKFTFSANNCAPRTYDVSVSKGVLSGLENGVELHLYGDVTGDEKINSSDILKAKLQAKGSQKLSDYDFAVADVTKDGKVNSTDILKLKLHAKGSTKLW